MSALLWEEAHPELSEAMFGCWNAVRCWNGQKIWYPSYAGTLCSSIFDKRSTVLELARTSPSAVHFWMEISRLAPTMEELFARPLTSPNETFYRCTRVLRMVIRDQDGLDGLDALEKAMSDTTRFATVHQRIDEFLPNGQSRRRGPYQETPANNTVKPMKITRFRGRPGVFRREKGCDE